MQNSDPSGKLLSIGESSEYLGISIDTLRRWEKKGRINPLRSPGGHRYYSKADLDALFGKRYTRDEETMRRTDLEIGKTDNADTSTPASSENSISPVSDQIPPEPLEQLISLPDEAEIPLHSSANKDLGLSSGTPEVQTVAEIPHLQTEVDSLKTDPQKDSGESFQLTNITPPSETSVNSNIVPENKAVSDTVSTLLIPTNSSNQMSEEEIERRVNSIIKKEPENSTGDIILAIASFATLAADIVLLYIWFTTTKITSPIP